MIGLMLFSNCFLKSKIVKNNKIRKICVFSGKRGGFGAYIPLMRLIEKDPVFQLQIILGDMHGSNTFGDTAKEAKRFFPKSKIVIIKMGAGRGDSPVIRTENLGTCLHKAAGFLSKLNPDILMVHGDRGEHLVMALVALNLGIPVFHTQGGEVSGNIDDVQRHAITKLAHLHFPETETAKKRIEVLGEESWRICVAGSLYVDRIVRRMFTNPVEVRKKYGLKPEEKYFIIIYHPDTYLSQKENYRVMKNVLTAVESFGLRSIVIYPCSDPGYQGVIDAIDEVKENSDFLIYKNIENLDFLGLLTDAEALIGNSSTALVEAPYLKLPAVNVGNRQLGRDREENVADVETSVIKIKNRLLYVTSDKLFREQLKKCGYRLGNGRASEQILKVIRGVSLDEKLLRKKLI